MEIIEIAKNDPGLTQAEALKAVEEKGLRLLTNKEADAILQDDVLREKYKDYFSLWTGTHVEYEGTDCTVTELGKKVKCKMPEKDNWHEQDQFGLPFGKLSERGNKGARYLWRIRKYKGLVARWDWWYVDDGRRYVCYFYPDGRLGVLAVRTEKHKHRYETKCADCGAVKGD